MLSRGVGKHIAVTLLVLSDDDDAGFIGIFTRGHRGIDCDHDSRQVRRCRRPRDAGTLGLITDRFFRYLIVRFAGQYVPIE
jgi:hypothetical protein